MKFNNKLSEEIISKYINLTISKKFINPWGILNDLDYCEKLIDFFITKIDKNFDSACILADSGLPLGILIAIKLKKPFCLHRKEAMNIENEKGIDQPYFIFPKPEKNQKILVIDSHINTGSTVEECIHRLKDDYKCKVTQIIAPINIKLLQNDKQFDENIKLICFDDHNYVRNQLMALLQEESLDNLITKFRSLIKKSNEFLEESENTYVESKFGNLLAILISIFINNNNNGIKNLFNKKTTRKIKKYFGDSEQELLQFLCKQPLKVIDICEKVKNKIALENYHVIIGTFRCGSILALYLSSLTKSCKKVFSTYQLSIRKCNEVINSNDKCLIVSGRIRTGNYIKYLSRKLSHILDENNQEDIIIFRSAPDGIKFPRNKLFYRVTNLKRNIYKIS